MIDDITPDPIPTTEPAREKRLDYAEMLNSVGGDEEILLNVLEVFLQQCTAMRAALCDAAADGDGIRLARAAHSLRGGAGIFLTKTATQLLSDLEACGKSDSFSEVERLLSAFSVEMDQIEDELNDVASAGVLCA
jgi:two-component system, sensor histidine kinase and response regulator